MNDRLVSIIVRTIDRPLYLRECLQSIVLQDYTNIEIVVVNDGGPSIAELVKEVCGNIPNQVYEFPETYGRSVSGNLGLEKAEGEYIGFLDDDDIFYPHHISTLVDAMKQQKCKVVYSDSLRADQIVCPFDPRRYMTVHLSSVFTEDFDYSELLHRNYIPIQCCLFEKSCVSDGIRFDPFLDVLEDWDFWIQLGEHNHFHHIKEITSEYRVRSDGSNTTGQLDHMWRYAADFIRQKHQQKRDARLKLAAHS